MREVTVRTMPPGKHTQSVEVGAIRIVADEPADAGGDDLGPAPHELLLAALGACTSMTMKMYADRKGWPLQAAEVKLTAVRGAEFQITRQVTLTGDLSDEQRAGLMAIADKCPVHKTLTHPITITSQSTE